MSSLTPRLDAAEKAIYGNEIEVAKINAPFTEIVNESGQPRQISDLANNMKTSMGVERILTQKISRQDREFGINGEVVYSSGDERIRFVAGQWEQNSADLGNRAESPFNDDSAYIEVTFYGTGLNLLTLFDTNSRVFDITIDGVASGSKSTGSASSVLNSRNYGTNQILNITTGLALGIHTVKIKLSSSTAGNFYCYGVEILNESAQLATNPGKPRLDSVDRELQSQILSSYNTGFDAESDTLGTKGGRVLVYQDVDGNINKRLTATDTTAQYLGSTDHSKEEIIRTINYKEFGANRSDDFSTLPTSISDRAFTLDDGTTTLVGNDVRDGSFDAAAFPNGGVYVNSSGTTGGLILTFVGTGLDIIVTFGNSPETIDISIDGASVGSMSYDNNEKSVRRTIASGLPYGTHTVRIERGGGASQWMSVEDFIIYGPKKPELSSTDIELADYNIMADYVAPTEISGEISSQGVLRKVNMREAIYSGTWVSPTIGTNYPSGFYISSNINGSYVEYTFWGTGIVYHQGTSIEEALHTYTIDGNSNLSGFTVETNLTSGMTFDSATGQLTGTPANSIMGSSVSICDLPLGVHTLRITKTGATQDVWTGSFDIIAPIHINDNSFKVGSLSLKDSRVAVDVNNEETKNKVDWTKAKALLVYNQTDSKIEYSKNISAVLDNGTGNFRIFFNHPFKNKNSYIMTVGGNLSEIEASDSQREASFINVFGKTSTGTNTTTNWTTFAFFGELENEENIDLGDL